jgi:hypothetical protein
MFFELEILEMGVFVYFSTMNGALSASPQVILFEGSNEVICSRSILNCSTLAYPSRSSSWSPVSSAWRLRCTFMFASVVTLSYEWFSTVAYFTYILIMTNLPCDFVRFMV